MKEEWRAIEGYEGYYEVSNLGRVRTAERPYKNGKGIKEARILKPGIRKTGHREVKLYLHGKRTGYYVHRLVAEAFIPNPDNLPCVLHTVSVSDGGTDEVSNLRWGTPEENTFDIIKEVKENRERIAALEAEVAELKAKLLSLQEEKSKASS